MSAIWPAVRHLRWPANSNCSPTPKSRTHPRIRNWAVPTTGRASSARTGRTIRCIGTASVATRSERRISRRGPKCRRRARRPHRSWPAAAAPSHRAATRRRTTMMTAMAMMVAVAVVESEAHRTAHADSSDDVNAPNSDSNVELLQPLATHVAPKRRHRTAPQRKATTVLGPPPIWICSAHRRVAAATPRVRSHRERHPVASMLRPQHLPTICRCLAAAAAERTILVFSHRPPPMPI